MDRLLMPLSSATLSGLPDGIDRPRYDRSRLTPGIVHIGLGNFHRAHQAWYLHRLMQSGKALDWAIVGAGVRPYDATMREKLLRQDCLTTLITLDPDRTSAEVIGPMIDYLPIEDGNGPLVRQMSDPAIRIVSLTVTEGGYYLAADGGFDAGHADMVHDARYPDRPRTAFGAMIAALSRRRAAGALPFTAQSCDNLRGNGDILRQTVVGLARAIDPDLASWIDTNCAFPNSMVDCIVPATGPAEIALARSLGIDDAAPVTHESFRQWVVEDAFCAGRPPLEEVGVTLTPDVHRYESMKIRILNAGHQVLANVGEILALPTIADCMKDPQVSAFFHKVQTDEILPHVESIRGQTPQDYLGLVEHRFSNAAIRDTTRRVAFDGSSRHAGFLLPVLRDAIAAQSPRSGLALVEALWARMCAGTREDGSVIEPNDPHWVALNRAAMLAREDPEHWLGQPGLYGDIRADAAFGEAFVSWLDGIWTQGARAMLARYLDTD